MFLLLKEKLLGKAACHVRGKATLSRSSLDKNGNPSITFPSVLRGEETHLKALFLQRKATPSGQWLFLFYLFSVDLGWPSKPSLQTTLHHCPFTHLCHRLFLGLISSCCNWKRFLLSCSPPSLAWATHLPGAPCPHPCPLLPITVAISRAFPPALRALSPLLRWRHPVHRLLHRRGWCSVFVTRAKCYLICSLSRVGALLGLDQDRVHTSLHPSFCKMFRTLTKVFLPFSALGFSCQSFRALVKPAAPLRFNHIQMIPSLLGLRIIWYHNNGGYT